MGTFGGYTGNMHIPEEKRDEFAGQVAKILNYGGMMHAICQVLELVRKDRYEREKSGGTALAEVGKFSCILPARVIVYLMAELKKQSFWKLWKEVHETVCHDEIMKEYATQQLREERRWKKQPDDEPDRIIGNRTKQRVEEI